MSKGKDLNVVYKPVEDLIPYARNARTHSDEQIAQVAASIKEFGFTNPILIDGENGIIAGHGRLMAARKLGLEKVPTIELSHLSPTQKRAYILADNRLALNAGWDDTMLALELGELKELDYDLSLTGFDGNELTLLLDNNLNEGNTDEDEVPEIDETETPKTKLGDVWVCGEHRLVCGDSTKKEVVDVAMNGALADLVFTDPPYGVSYADKNHFLNSVDRGNCIQVPIKNDHMSVADTGDLIFKAFFNVKEHLADYSSYYITAPQGGDLLAMFYQKMGEAGIPLRHCLIWSKNNHVLGRCDYNYKHEPILYGWVNHHRFYGGGEHKFSVWEIPKPQKSDLHPTMKPVALVVNAILNSSKKGDVVLDVFGGSGTTMIAAEKTNRCARLVELDEHYCDVIVKRWQDFSGKEAYRESDGMKFNDIAN